MLIIGLTGGIGSGKSTVAHLFANLGVPIIDADIIAREITQPDQPAFAAIIKHFNECLLLPDGTLDRTALRKIIFKQPLERKWLENLLHPLIEHSIKKYIEGLTAPYCITVIPLLLEVSPYTFIDRILVIDAPENLQIERAMTRDSTDKTQIEAIMSTQINRQERLSKAQDIITNDGNLENLLPQVQKLHQFYLKLSHKEL